jgi:hypothetical protein
VRIVLETGLVHVRDVHHGLGRDHVQFLQDLALVIVEFERAHGLPLGQVIADLADRVPYVDIFFLCRLGVLVRLDELLLHGLEIGECELGVDRLDIVDRVDRARHVRDVVVLEAAHDMRDRIRLADIGKEFVAEPFALRCARDEAGNVDELHRRRDRLLRLDDVGKHIEPRIGHWHDTDVRVDGTERIVFGRDLGRGQRIKKRRFANVRQPYDATGNGHLVFLALFRVQLLHRSTDAVLQENP